MKQSEWISKLDYQNTFEEIVYLKREIVYLKTWNILIKI